MIRLANSTTLMSALLGLNRQGGAGDGTADLVRSSAARAERAQKTPSTKTPDHAAKTSTARPSVTVSLSPMAQAAQAAQAQSGAGLTTTETNGRPVVIGVSPFTPDERKKLEAVTERSLAQHRAYVRFHREGIMPSEDLSSLTPSQARQRLDDLSVLPRVKEVETQVLGWTSPQPFVFAVKEGETTKSMETYVGWLKERAQQSEATTTSPNVGLDIQV